MSENIIQEQSVKLTFKQRVFLDEYVKSGNATRSAISAGYSRRTAHSIGSELLQKDYIKSAIAQRMISGSSDDGGLSYFRECLLKSRNEKLNHTSSGFVYFLEEENGRVKIGKADDYKKRVNSISTACPYEIRLIGLIESDDCNSLERELHRKYSMYRVRGEWFELTELEKKEIAERYNPNLVDINNRTTMTLFSIEEFVT